MTQRDLSSTFIFFLLYFAVIRYFSTQYIYCRQYYYSALPHRGAEYCDECVCVYLSVCGTHLRNNTTKLQQIFFACCLWPWFGAPLAAALQYVMYFRFVGDVMFSTMGIMAARCSASASPQCRHCRVRPNTPAAWYWSPRLDEPFVQGVPGRSAQCTTALLF